jgi:hypothetical protein
MRKLQKLLPRQLIEGLRTDRILLYLKARDAKMMMDEKVTKVVAHVNLLEVTLFTLTGIMVPVPYCCFHILPSCTSSTGCFWYIGTHHGTNYYCGKSTIITYCTVTTTTSARRGGMLLLHDERPSWVVVR